MQFSQLRTLARQFLDDTNSGDYLWSDTELGAYINQAVREASIRSRCIVDSTSQDCSRINVIANGSSYPVHGAVFFIDRVYDATNKQRLTKTTIKALDNVSDDWPYHTGNPTHFLLDADHYRDGDESMSLRIYPTPTASAVLNLTVFRSQLADLSGVDEPEIQTYKHLDLLHWVLHLAYMKQDADTFNAEKAIQFGERFERAFGMAQDASQLEWRRKHTSLRVAGAYL